MPDLQLVYYKAIVWLMPATWFLAFWVTIAFIVAAATDDTADVGLSILYFFIYDIFLFGFEAIAWYIAPYNVKYYRWNEQEWWNYETADDMPNQFLGL